MKPVVLALLATVLLLAGVLIWLKSGDGSASLTTDRTNQPGANAQDIPPPSIEATSAQAATREEVAGPTENGESSAEAEMKRPGQGSADGIHGRVVNDLGSPVQHFTIESHRPGEWLRDISTRTDSDDALLGKYESPDGTFDLPILSRGEWVLVARGVGDTRSVPVPVSANARLPDLVLVLPRPAVVSGLIQATDGSPVDTAGVFVRYEGEDDSLDGDRTPRARTDALGRFHIEGVQPGAFHLTANHPEFRESDWTQVSAASGGEAQVTIILSPGGRITGTVDPSQGDLSRRQIDLISFRGSIGWRSTTSDDAGAFTIEHVIPQDYIIELRAPGYPHATADELKPGIRKPISVREGETTHVVLGENLGAIRVQGRVLCNGVPLARIEVSARPKDGGEDRMQPATTEEGGRFELEVNGPGQYVFHVRASSGSYASIERAIDTSTPVDLTLEIPGGAISGTVLSASGRGLPSVPVTILRDAEASPQDSGAFWRRYRRTKTNSEGRFEFDMLDPGTYVLRAPDGFQQDLPPPRTPHGRSIVSGLQVGVASTEPLVIRLPPEGRILGRVVDPAGVPVPSAWVRVLDNAGVSLSGAWETSSDVTGSFEVGSVAPGYYTVSVQASERRGTSSAVQVEAGKTTSEVVVTLP